ncbi:MAG: DUF885 domain-containing protein [Vicinamibacterales bacterium]
MLCAMPRPILMALLHRRPRGTRGAAGDRQRRAERGHRRHPHAPGARPRGGGRSGGGTAGGTGQRVTARAPPGDPRRRADVRRAHRPAVRRDDPHRPPRARARGADDGRGGATRMLREQYLLPYDAAGLWDYARAQFDATVRELEALAQTIDPSKTWRQIADEVKQDHPDPLRMIGAHQEVVDKARAHLVSHDLMSLPWPETCTVVRRVPTPGNNPYYGNFSGATSRPPAPDGTLRGEWHINPFLPEWDEPTKRDYLLEHDWGVIYVTAPHETYGGHHVQIIYQMHNPRPLRQRQGTPMFSEGWGLYNEQLFQETGFLPSPRIHLRQLQLRLWRNARVIYDVGMQTGRMTRDQAIALMTDQVGFLRWAAEAEIDSALDRPGYFIGYFMGMSEILKMREEYKAKVGAAFTLKDFHDRLLRIGSMPPALVREALLR